MVRVSHQRSEGCGFDSRLGLRNVYLGLLAAKKFSFNLPSCKSLDIYLILDIYRHIETAELGAKAAEQKKSCGGRLFHKLVTWLLVTRDYVLQGFERVAAN